MGLFQNSARTLLSSDGNLCSIVFNICSIVFNRFSNLFSIVFNLFQNCRRHDRRERCCPLLSFHIVFHARVFWAQRRAFVPPSTSQCCALLTRLRVSLVTTLAVWSFQIVFRFCVVVNTDKEQTRSFLLPAEGPPS